ncbi:MAG TPA: APC family permease [Bryobacteraceae bacterium]|jgi:amino acid transporter|nr:APC family permease [Bryobacteraceae bacterium]
MSKTAGPARLKPFLRLPALVLFGITFVGPTAPFPMFGIVSSVSKGHMALAYLIALCAMVLTAISYGKMSAAYPAAGSAYTYSRRSLHPAAGFLVGWTMLLDYMLLPLLSVIYVSITFARLMPFVPYRVWLVLCAMVMTAVNLFGLKVTNKANFAMTAIMMAAVIWFVTAAIHALFEGQGAAALLSSQPFYNPAAFSLRSVMAGTSIAAFSYLGFDGISTLAEDCKDPRRDIGRATVLVCLICGFLFIPQAYLGQLLWPDFATFPNVETAFLDVARLAGGAALFSMVSFVLVVAGFASAITGQASASRLLFGMARDRLLPSRIFTYIHPKHSTPTFGVLAVGVVAVLGGFYLSFQLAAEAVNFGALLGFMSVNLSVVSHYFIRERERGFGGLFSNLILPCGGFLVCLYVFLNLSVTAKWVGVVWCGVGLVLLAVLTSGFRVKLDDLIPAQAFAEEN